MVESTSQDEPEELQNEIQEQDALPGNDYVAEAEGGPTEKKRKIPKEPTILSREPGKSLLPFSRVQKIIKADKEIPVMAKDAVFLISLATEEFIKRFSEASQKVAEREKRTTVQHRDIATVVRRADKFLFLDELIPWMAPDAAPKRPIGNPRDAKEDVGAAPTMLDQFVKVGKKNEEESQDDDIITYGTGEEMQED